MKKIVSVLLVTMLLLGSLSMMAFAETTITFSPVNPFFDSTGVIAGTKYEFQATAALTSGQSIVYYNGETELGTLSDTETVAVITMNEGENRIWAEVVDGAGETVAVSPATVVFANYYEAFTPALTLDFNGGTTSGTACNKPIINANDEVDKEHGKSLCITNTYSGEGDLPTQDQVFVSLPSYTSAGSIYEYSADFYFKDFTPSDRQILGLAGGMDVYNVTVHRGGILKVGNSSAKDYDKGNTEVMKLETNRWYNFKRVINFRDQSVSLYVDGVFKHKKTYSVLKTKAPTMMIHRSFQETWNYGAVTIAYYMDNITFKKVAPNPTATVSYLNGSGSSVDANQVPYEDASIKLAFSEAMDETLLTDKNITLTTQDGLSVETTIAYDATAKVVTVTPKKVLNSNHTYTIALKDLKSADGVSMKGESTFQFKTEKLPFCVDELSIADGSQVDSNHGKQVTVNVKFRNVTGTSQSAVLFVSVFDENSMYTDCQLIPTTVTTTPEPLPVTLRIPAEDGDYQVKACLVNALTDLNIFDMYILD